MSDLRVGLGIDLHAWDLDRQLVLGGVRFDHEPGLAGHSDGDVVCHALADALLGAAGLGDVGQHFPDSDPALQGIGGLDLLGRTVALLADAGRTAESCDLTVLAERPHISPRRDEIRATLATTLGVPADAVSVKATRPEGLGLSGDGVGCFAVAIVRG
jgi:2-C-methyl-D-erythritol 2,4-cyclodiphosphate synthase